MATAGRDMEPQLDIRRFAMHLLTVLSFALVFDVPTYLVDLTNPKVSEYKVNNFSGIFSSHFSKINYDESSSHFDIAVSTVFNIPDLDAWKFPYDPGGRVQETARVLIKNINQIVMFDLVLFAYGTKSSAVCFSPCPPITADPSVVVASNENAWEERERSLTVKHDRHWLTRLSPVAPTPRVGGSYETCHVIPNITIAPHVTYPPHLALSLTCHMPSTSALRTLMTPLMRCLLVPVTALVVPSIASDLEYPSNRLSTILPYLDRLVATLLAPSGGRTGIREPGTPEGIGPTCYWLILMTGKVQLAFAFTCNPNVVSKAQACLSPAFFVSALVPGREVEELSHLIPRSTIGHRGYRLDVHLGDKSNRRSFGHLTNGCTLGFLEVVSSGYSYNPSHSCHSRWDSIQRSLTSVSLAVGLKPLDDMPLPSMTITSFIIALMIIPTIMTRAHVNGVWLWLLVILVSIPIVSAGEPNTRSDYDRLEGVKEWNGRPYHDFLVVWFAALCAALAAIVQDGATLLDCAQGTDPGRTAGHDDASRALHDKHLLRRTRLGACILKYIKPNTGVHMTLTNHDANRGPVLDGNGILMFKYVKTMGHLPRTDNQLERVRSTWEHATMANVGIAYTDAAIFEWVDWLNSVNMKYGLKKNRRQIRNQFLQGFPSSFDVVITPERLIPDPGTYRVPANYPDWHPLSGQANPQANQASIELAATALYPEWSRRVGKDIKPLPKGMVHRARVATSHAIEDDELYGGECHEVEPDDPTHDPHDEDSLDDDSESESLSGMSNQALQAKVRKQERMLRYHETTPRKIGPDDICKLCGGRGHWSRVGGKQCLTAELGNKVPQHELAMTRYPNGLTYPLDSKVKESKSRRVENDSPTRRPKSPHASRRPHVKGKPKGKGKFKPKRSVRKVETTNEAPPSDSESSESSDDSSGEVGNLVSLMAVHHGPIVTPPPSPPSSPGKAGSSLYP